MIRIHAIQTGSVGIKTAQLEGRGQGVQRLLNVLTDPVWTEPMPIYAWVIEHSEGIIVVDTGETARSTEQSYFPRWHPFFRRATRFYVCPDDEIGPQLRRLGIAPRDVRWVVLTHLHTDHAGGLAHFPASEILIAREEYQVAKGIPGRIRGYLPERWPTWLRPRLIDFAPQPGGPFPASFPLTSAEDIILLSTPGHTAHHLSVLVRDSGLSYILAGDASYSEQLMLRQVTDGVSPNPAITRQTLSRLRDYAQSNPTVYLPSHDPAAARRLATRTTVSLPQAASA
ncbi:MAG TPA: N-acyl homoserine lactonase family protein [Ktedonobacteraceae bacterium]